MATKTEQMPWDCLKELPFQSDAYGNLQQLGEGLHKCGWLGGWIEVEAKDSSYDVMWCSGKTTHHPFSGHAISVKFGPDVIGFVSKSAVSMWPVYEDARRLEWARWMESKIRRAVKRFRKT